MARQGQIFTSTKTKMCKILARQEQILIDKILARPIQIFTEPGQVSTGQIFAGQGQRKTNIGKIIR